MVHYLLAFLQGYSITAMIGTANTGDIMQNKFTLKKNLRSHGDVIVKTLCVRGKNSLMDRDQSQKQVTE